MKRLIILSVITLSLCPSLIQANHGFMDKMRHVGHSVMAKAHKVNEHRVTSGVKAAIQTYIAGVASIFAVQHTYSLVGQLKDSNFRIDKIVFNRECIGQAILAGGMYYVCGKLLGNVYTNGKHALGIK